MQARAVKLINEPCFDFLDAITATEMNNSFLKLIRCIEHSSHQHARHPAGLRTRSIFYHVQVRVQEIFANPSSSSSSKNFIF